jgi:hypothetical protein
MATISKKINKDGSEVYRMIVRRKGLPLFTMTFSTRKEAVDWVDMNEELYIKNPEPFNIWLRKNRLRLEREREFKRKS